MPWRRRITTTISIPTPTYANGSSTMPAVPCWPVCPLPPPLSPSSSMKVLRSLCWFPLASSQSVHPARLRFPNLGDSHRRRPARLLDGAVARARQRPVLMIGGDHEALMGKVVPFVRLRNAVGHWNTVSGTAVGPGPGTSGFCHSENDHRSGSEPGPTASRSGDCSDSRPGRQCRGTRRHEPGRRIFRHGPERRNVFRQCGSRHLQERVCGG